MTIVVYLQVVGAFHRLLQLQLLDSPRRSWVHTYLDILPVEKSESRGRQCTALQSKIVSPVPKTGGIGVIAVRRELGMGIGAGLQVSVFCCCAFPFL